MLCYKAADTAKNPSAINIIEWWQNKTDTLPLLSKAARFIYAIPAGSSAPENCFSAAGFIYSDRRTNMKPKKLENLLMLRCNRDLEVNTAMEINALDEYYDSEDEGRNETDGEDSDLPDYASEDEEIGDA